MKLQLWDTAGEEKYKSLTSVYYRNAHAVIILFDLTRPETFKSVLRWLTGVQEHCDDAHVVLVGNKCDLETVVDFDEIEVPFMFVVCFLIIFARLLRLRSVITRALPNALPEKSMRAIYSILALPCFLL